MINKCRVRVYAADIKPLEDKEIYDFIYKRVSERRRIKTDKMIFLKDKYLSLGAEYLLMCALNDFGLKYDEVRIEEDKNGKPYLMDQSYFFNLSHSGSRVMCIISDKEAGCDVEEIKRADMEIAREFFSEDEYEKLISAENEKEMNELFFSIWTRKESFMKCTGNDIDIEIDESSCSIFSENKDDGYIYSWCIKKEKEDVLEYETRFIWREIRLYNTAL